MKELEERINKQLEFAERRASKAKSESEEEAWEVYGQALKFVLAEIKIIQNDQVREGK